MDVFTGYVIAKASASRTAQTVAKGYEECVFRRFGASEVIRHDREQSFMSEFFRAFNRMVGQRQRTTIAYRPQANGNAERMVQTLTRSIKMYVSDVGQQDWDEYAERLTFALNTAQDRVRKETPFYFVHGWDAKTTLEATLPVVNTRTKGSGARGWRYHIQSHYQRTREQVNEHLRSASQARVLAHYKQVVGHKVRPGVQVWLYLDRVKEGYAKKLAHLWHGPFRVLKLVGEYAAWLEVRDMTYRLFPVVHVSKLKRVREFPDRPSDRLTVDEADRIDFDECLLPEDSWTRELEEGEYEVEEILESRINKKTRYGRQRREFLIRWKGHADP